MADKTAISWCDATFNSWWGCQKVSPACDHCYAERDAKRFAPGKVLWGVGSERRTFEDKHWRAPMLWAKTMPAKLGRRPRVFCASMADWLDLDAPISEFVRLLELIRTTPELDWLLLTKRIGNWRKRLEETASATVGTGALNLWITQWLFARTPPANVWLGATVIDQAEADRDVPKLLAVPARVRFLSIEPMLGPVDLGQALVGGLSAVRAGNTIDWVIAGGESGPHARPAHPKWFRSLRDQCAAAGVPFHFKQWGEWAPPTELVKCFNLCANGVDGEALSDGAVYAGTCRNCDGSGLQPYVKVGKAAAGRLLDGVEHNGRPT